MDEEVSYKLKFLVMQKVTIVGVRMYSIVNV